MLDEVLFDIGIGLECECWLFLVFIWGECYGMWVSMFVLIDYVGVGCIVEWWFGLNGCLDG